MAGLTQQAFDDRVAGYADSPCHRSGPSLPLVLEFANVSPEYFVLDVGTGTGFTAHALVQLGAYVDALDVSRPMLRHTRATAPAPLRAGMLPAAAREVMGKDLSTRDTEALVRRLNKPRRVKSSDRLDPDLSNLVETLQRRLGTRVRLMHRASDDKGKLEIEYYSQDDLERITSMMMGNV